MSSSDIYIVMQYLMICRCINEGHSPCCQANTAKSNTDQIAFEIVMDNYGLIKISKKFHGITLFIFL